MEEVILFLMQEGFAPDENSAIRIYEAMSDEWLENIMEKTESSWDRPEMIDKSRKFIKKHGLKERDPKKFEKARQTIQNILGDSGIKATGTPQSAPRRRVTTQTFEVR